MVVCPACLSEGPDGARFCATCGRALAPGTATGRAPTPAPADVAEERKVVSVLFCDLVGFTAMSEAADPEDVDRVLTAYGAMARAAIAAHGGVVEKFIGDAVVGVFGVPATHEDDGLRAVRAGLAICEGAMTLRALDGAALRLRVGINTGEALVRLDIAPDAGERFMTGDAINTAARIQSVAPELGVAVGETTWQATRTAVEFVDAPPATLKGKSEPVRIFHATGVRSVPRSDPSRAHAGDYVGRSTELGTLRTLFDRTASERRGGFALVVGEPGIGKSRIVEQLRRHAEVAAPGMMWHQGSCLPYGDGVTFWALGEIVKGHAGILEGDDPALTAAKLDAALRGSADRDWLRARLMPLVGLSGGPTPSREEAFAAWRSFLVELCAAGPAVVVIEDLHWADEGLLAFVADLPSHLDGIPLLLVGTTRPELLARSALATLPGLVRVDLAPLSDAEADAFVEGLLGSSVPHEIRAAILERAEGNPLFAEEYVRLLDDRGLLVATDEPRSLRVGSTIPVPDSLGALLAARLDTLPRTRKSLLADASVVGTVFWAGAVAAIGGRDPVSVRLDLADLARLEFVREIEPSSMVDEDEAAFWHALGRDVAYSQLPRASRAARHRAIAAWLEAKAGERVEDIADVLAHHYATALELCEATGDLSTAAAVRPAAARFLRLAGDRAIGLDTTAALEAYERSLALVAEDDPERAIALQRVGRARLHAGEYERAVTAYRDALDRFEAAGDAHAGALVKLELTRALQWVGPPHWELIYEAVDALEVDGPSADLVDALGRLTFGHMVTDRNEDAIATAGRAIEMATSLGLPPPASAYAWRATARLTIGDPAGLDDGRLAIDMATRAGASRDAAIFRNEHVANVACYLGWREADAAARDLLQFAASRGLGGIERLARATLADVLLEAGRLDEAEQADFALLEEFIAAGDVTMVSGALFGLARIATIRGEAARALELVDRIEADPHLRDNPAWSIYVAGAARVHAAAGDLANGRRLLLALERADRPTMYRPFEVRDAVVAALLVGDLDLARRFAESSADPRPTAAEARRTAHALIAEAEGDIDRAVDGLRLAADALEALSLPDHTHALLGYGRCLATLRRTVEAEAPLRAARDLADRMGATPWRVEADSLLAGIARPAP